MPFAIPPNPKPVRDATAKIYKSYLNRLTYLDINNIDDIVKNPIDTVIAIDILTELLDDDEEKKRERRMYYSAVFFVLYGQPILQDPHNELRKGFARNNPSINLKDGTPWKPEYKDPDTA